MVKIIKLPFLMLVISITLAYAINCPTPDQVKICNDDETNCRCVPCPVCKPGEGLNYECLGTLSDRVTLKCIPCKPGETYSSGNHTGNCQPCPRCEGHVTESPCNITSPTKCSPDKCRDGHKWSNVVDNCVRIHTAAPMPSTTDHPTTNSTTTTAAASTSTTPTQSTKPTPTTRTLATPEVPITKIEHSTKIDSNDETPKPESSSDNNEKHHKENKFLIIAVLGLIVVAGILTAVYKKKNKIRHLLCQKCCKSGENEQAEESLPLKVKGQESPPLYPKENPKVDIFPWPEGLLLKDISHNIQDIITIAISNPPTHINGWKQIGEKLEVDTQSLKGIGNYPQQERGVEFIKVLNIHQFSLTLTKFMEKCEELRRGDIVEEVKKEYEQTNLTFKSSQKEVNEGEQEFSKICK